MPPARDGNIRRGQQGGVRDELPVPHRRGMLLPAPPSAWAPRAGSGSLPDCARRARWIAPYTGRSPRSPPRRAGDGARRACCAADKSRIWLAIAAGLAIAGGPTGRRAATRGVLAIGVTSAVVNLGVKSLYARRRPDRAGAGGVSRTEGPDARLDVISLRAFGVGVRVRLHGRPRPALGPALGLHLLAGSVAYSRVHTGVHYPGDTVIGALIGASTGHSVSGILDRHAHAVPLIARPSR